MPRLRRRLDALQGDAHSTMAFIRAVLEEFTDGVSVTVVMSDDSTFMDLLTGKTRELPFKIVIDASDDGK